MISVSSSIDRRVVLFFLYLSLSLFLSCPSIMAENANALSISTSDAPIANTSTRSGTRPYWPHQSFKGQNFLLWNLTVTTDNLKASYYNKIKQITSAVTTLICVGNLTHVLQAIEAGKDTAFTKPTLASADPTDQIIFKIEHEEFSKDKRTYDNNKTKLTQSLLGQCAPPIVNQPRGMKGHSAGQYDVLWVLCALSQMCSSIRNDQIPLLQVLNSICKVFTHKQQEQQSATAFKEDFVQHVRAMKAVGAIITLPAACLELEKSLDPNKTLSNEVKQSVLSSA